MAFLCSAEAILRTIRVPRGGFVALLERSGHSQRYNTQGGTGHKVNLSRLITSALSGCNDELPGSESIGIHLNVP